MKTALQAREGRFSLQNSQGMNEHKQVGSHYIIPVIKCREVKYITCSMGPRELNIFFLTGAEPCVFHLAAELSCSPHLCTLFVGWGEGRQ